MIIGPPRFLEMKGNGGLVIISFVFFWDSGSLADLPPGTFISGTPLSRSTHRSVSAFFYASTSLSKASKWMYSIYKICYMYVIPIYMLRHIRSWTTFRTTKRWAYWKRFHICSYKLSVFELSLNLVLRCFCFWPVLRGFKMSSNSIRPILARFCFYHSFKIFSNFGFWPGRFWDVSVWPVF